MLTYTLGSPYLTGTNRLLQPQSRQPSTSQAVAWMRLRQLQAVLPLIEVVEPGTDSVLMRAMQDIQSKIWGAIAGGTIVGIDPADVLIEKLSTDRGRLNPLPPTVLISHPGPEQILSTGTCQRDDIAYNVVVALVLGDNQDQQVRFGMELNVRQNIRRLFNAKRLSPLCTESVVCWVKPGVTVHQDAWVANLFLSFQVVQCVTREVRTQG